MKKVYIAFAIEKDGSIVPHQHPVFTGQVAYDLVEGQEVQECKDLKVREFNGPSEIIAAVQDYNRECQVEEYEEVGDVYVIERLTFSGQAIASRKPKSKSVLKSK